MPQSRDHQRIFSARLIGQSVAMRALRRNIGAVAKADLPVLITGDAGTGKGLIAKLIHEKSARRDKPFIEINLATIPANLAVSELVGHKKGSFTGAVQDHQGLLHEANEGTVYLVDIDKASAEVQSVIIRAIDSGIIRRLGGGMEVPTNFRVIAAASSELEPVTHIAGRAKRASR